MIEVIENFYQSFNYLDAESMISYYHNEVEFTDPAFGELKGERAKNMWRMLCDSQNGKEFKVTVSNIDVKGNTGSCDWEAFYTFSKTGRKVHNKIHAEFEFKDGMIIKHTDHFNLYRWAQQALGFQGYLIGWSGYFQSKLQKQTSRLLDRFEGTHP